MYYIGIILPHVALVLFHDMYCYQSKRSASNQVGAVDSQHCTGSCSLREAGNSRRRHQLPTGPDLTKPHTISQNFTHFYTISQNFSHSHTTSKGLTQPQRPVGPKLNHSWYQGKSMRHVFPIKYPTRYSLRNGEFYQAREGRGHKKAMAMNMTKNKTMTMTMTMTMIMSICTFLPSITFNLCDIVTIHFNFNWDHQITTILCDLTINCDGVEHLRFHDISSCWSLFTSQYWSTLTHNMFLLLRL